MWLGYVRPQERGEVGSWDGSTGVIPKPGSFLTRGSPRGQASSSKRDIAKWRPEDYKVWKGAGNDVL